MKMNPVVDFALFLLFPVGLKPAPTGNLFHKWQNVKLSAPFETNILFDVPMFISCEFTERAFKGPSG